MRAPGAEHLRVDHDPTHAFEAKLQNLRESRRRRARRRLLIAIAIPVVVLLAATTFVLTQRSVSTAVSLDEATAKFRADPPKRTNTTIGSAKGATTSEEAETESGSATVEPGTQPGKAVMFAALPVQGVYTYRATGGEQISVFGANHQYPERVYATVRHLGGCMWEHRLDVIEEHVDRRQLCNDEGQLLQLLQARHVEFFGKRDGGTMRCDPPALQHATTDEPGATSSARCVDAKTGDHATVTRTFSSMRTLNIAGRSVEALHYTVDSTFTGHATGSSHDQLWVGPETGMVLRWDRTVDTMADAAFGAEVRYQEKASFVLESLTPQT